MFESYDAKIMGRMIDKIVPIAKKTQDPNKLISNLFEVPYSAKEATAMEETTSHNPAFASFSGVIREKKPYKKVYREYPEKNDSVCLLEAVNPYSFVQVKREEDCHNTTTILSCDLCYNHIEGSHVSSNCELQHKCRYHPECWKKLIVGESILCLRNITTKPHYLTSYDNKELVVPEKEYNKIVDSIAEVEEIAEDRVVEIKEWQSSYRAIDVEDIPVYSKPQTSEYVVMKKKKNRQKQKKRLELGDFYALARKEAEEKRIKHNLKLKEDAIRRRREKQLNPNALPFVPRQWKLVPILDDQPS